MAQTYLKASNTGAGDLFGHTVALSGDGDTLAVGALQEDSNATGVSTTAPTAAGSGATDSGAVYVFTRSGATWSQSAYLKASNTGAGDGFGHSAGLSGDTLVFGALQEDSNATGVSTTAPTAAGSGATDSGAVYVFTRSGATWSQSAYLKASNTGAGDLFGHSVALSGDTLAINAYREDSNATGVSTTTPTTAGSGASETSERLLTSSSCSWSWSEVRKSGSTASTRSRLKALSPMTSSSSAPQRSVGMIAV